MPYQFIPHTADIGFKTWGQTLAELFASAAKALTEAMITNAEGVPKTKIAVHLKAETPEELLVQWLEEILFLFETKALVGLEFEIKQCDRGALNATIQAMEWDTEKQPLKTQVKAVTFHGLEIIETPKGCEAQIILDV